MLRSVDSLRYRWLPLGFGARRFIGLALFVAVRRTLVRAASRASGEDSRPRTASTVASRSWIPRYLRSEVCPISDHPRPAEARYTSAGRQPPRAPVVVQSSLCTGPVSGTP